MDNFSKQLESFLLSKANAANAQPMAVYMKNHFPFLGIKSPERVALFRQFLKDNTPPQYPTVFETAWDLYALPQREFHYCAIEILSKTKKEWQREDIIFFEKMIITNSWWDSVDFINSVIISVYFEKFPDQIRPITEQWMASQNIWLQRICLIFQLPYKKKTDTDLLFDYINRLKGSKEFFIQKAIGWALRQYARTNPDLIREFVENTELKLLSKREALKHIG